MSNRKKSKWERTMQMERNQSRHLRSEEIIIDGKGESRLYGTAKYFSMERQIKKLRATFKRNYDHVKK